MRTRLYAAWTGQTSYGDEGSKTTQKGRQGDGYDMEEFSSRRSKREDAPRSYLEWFVFVCRASLLSSELSNDDDRDWPRRIVAE